MRCAAVLTATCEIKTATRTTPCGLTKFQTATAPQKLKTTYRGAVWCGVGGLCYFCGLMITPQLDDFFSDRLTHRI